AIVEEDTLRRREIHTHRIKEIDCGQLDFRGRVEAGHIAQTTAIAAVSAAAPSPALSVASRARDIKRGSLLIATTTATTATTGGTGDIDVRNTGHTVPALSTLSAATTATAA